MALEQLAALALARAADKSLSIDVAVHRAAEAAIDAKETAIDDKAFFRSRYCRLAAVPDLEAGRAEEAPAAAPAGVDALTPLATKSPVSAPAPPSSSLLTKSFTIRRSLYITCM